MSQPTEPAAQAIAERDELDAELSALAVYDLDELRSAHLGSQARAAFLGEHRQASSSWLDSLGRVYHRALEPALVTAFCAGYLAWAFDAVLLVYR